MAFPVSTRSTGTLITASIWNADLKDNLTTLRAGGIAIASQAASDMIYASSSTQLARAALTRGQMLRKNLANSAIEAFNPPTVLDCDASSTTVGPSSTTETTVYSGTIPGGLMGTSRVVRVSLVGDYLNNSGGASDLTIRLYLNATEALKFTLASLTSVATRRTLRMEAEVSANNSASAQVAWGRATTHYTGDTSASTASNMLSGNGVLYEHTQVDLAENSASDITLAIKFQHSVSSASISATAYRTLVEIL